MVCQTFESNVLTLPVPPSVNIIPLAFWYLFMAPIMPSYINKCVLVMKGNRRRNSQNDTKIIIHIHKLMNKENAIVNPFFYIYYSFVSKNVYIIVNILCHKFINTFWNTFHVQFFLNASTHLSKMDFSVLV